MLERLDELINQQVDFAFETTLSTKSFASLCRKAKIQGYTVYLVFLWLDSPSLAFERVRQRVLEGGHNIPEETVLRRYTRGVKNFHNLYKNIVDYWLFFDNSETNQELIAEGRFGEPDQVYNIQQWQKIKEYA